MLNPRSDRVNACTSSIFNGTSIKLQALRDRPVCSYITNPGMSLSNQRTHTERLPGIRGPPRSVPDPSKWTQLLFRESARLHYESDLSQTEPQLQYQVKRRKLFEIMGPLSGKNDCSSQNYDISGHLKSPLTHKCVCLLPAFELHCAESYRGVAYEHDL